MTTMSVQYRVEGRTFTVDGVFVGYTASPRSVATACENHYLKINPGFRPTRRSDDYDIYDAPSHTIEVSVTPELLTAIRVNEPAFYANYTDEELKTWF